MESLGPRLSGGNTEAGPVCGTENADMEISGPSVLVVQVGKLYVQALRER